jgi:hypothetical protein
MIRGGSKELLTNKFVGNVGLQQCCKYRFGEYIAKGQEINLSEIPGKISEIIEKYQQA